MPTNRKQTVTACGRYVVMPDGSRFKRTVIPHPSKVQKQSTEDEALIDELSADEITMREEG